jgi:hypothetical protein
MQAVVERARANPFNLRRKSCKAVYPPANITSSCIILSSGSLSRPNIELYPSQKPSLFHANNERQLIGRVAVPDLKLSALPLRSLRLSGEVD